MATPGSASRPDEFWYRQGEEPAASSVSERERVWNTFYGQSSGDSMTDAERREDASAQTNAYFSHRRRAAAQPTKKLTLREQSMGMTRAGVGAGKGGRKEPWMRCDPTLAPPTAKWCYGFCCPFTALDTGGDLSVRMPTFPPLPSHPITVRATGSFAVQTANNLGFLLVRPWALLFRDGLNGTTTIPGVSATGAASTVATMLQAGTPASMPELNYGDSPYTWSTFDPSAAATAGNEARLTACALRIRLVSAERGRGDQIVLMEQPSHISLGLTALTLSEARTKYKRVTLLESNADHDWMHVTCNPVSTHDLEYLDRAGATSAPFIDDAYLGAYVVGNNDAAGNGVYSYEVVACFEVIGPITAAQALDPPVADPVGVAAVLATSDHGIGRVETDPRNPYREALRVAQETARAASDWLWQNTSGPGLALAHHVAVNSGKKLAAEAVRRLALSRARARSESLRLELR